MFERFTEAARTVVVDAQAEARRLGHGWIGSEHLLIALAAAPGGPAVAALQNAGVTPDAARRAVAAIAGTAESRLDAGALAVIGIDLDEVRRRVEAAFGPGALDRRSACRDGRLPFTKRAKRALERALRIAMARGDTFIGSEHVLLGVLEDPDSLAVEALKRLGIPPERIRERLAVPSA
jgi:ATP-dependent Clp protease ATP-binding subunit ClpA